MRQSVFVACCLLFLVVAAPTLAGEDHPFFDLENCAMCKNLLEDPALLPNLVWENHSVNEGMLTVTVYKTPEAAESYAKAHSKMEAVAQKMMAGEMMPMCGFCKSTMALMKEGATMETVAFEGGEATLMTSTNPETVEHIHAHCEKINSEMKKMEMEG